MRYSSEKSSSAELEKGTKAAGLSEPPVDSKINSSRTPSKPIYRQAPDQGSDRFKILFWLGSLLALSMPVFIALELSPSLFPGSFSSYSFSSEEATSGLEGLTPFKIQVKNGSSYAKVASDIWLDPQSGKNFLVSFLVNLQGFPPNGIRQNIITKYQADREPYPGWSVAIKNLGTSLRLQVYWQGLQGKGGWYSFEDLGLSLGRWYSISLVKTDTGEILLTVEDASENNIRFAGGLAIPEVGNPISSTSFVIGSSREGKRAFRGEVAQVLVAHPEELPSNRSQLLQLLQGGGSALLESLKPKEVGFWLNQNGRDGSRFRRDVQLRGSVAKATVERTQ